MTRNYANISTAIWRNDEFRDLSRDAQHMYLLLTSQPDITAAGVLSLNVKRWSTRTKSVTTNEVVAALNELQAHRFIVFDNETEELLVRSFVRWDSGYGNAKRRPVILRAAQEIESSTLREWIAAEFHRLSLPTDGLTDGDGDSPSDGPSGSSRTEIQPDLFSQENRLSDGASPGASASDGVVGTKGELDVPPTHNPHSPSQATAAAKPRPETGTRLSEDWVDTDEGQRAAAWAKNGYPKVDLGEETIKFVNHWLSKTGKDATKRDWYRTFQNWIIEANRRLGPGNRNHQDGRMSGGMSTSPKAVPAGEKCPRHPSYRAGTCAPCRSESLAARGSAA